MNWLQFSLVCFTATVVAAVIVLTRGWHGRWTGDPVTGGVQKHHHGAPPRIGILPLLAAVAVGWWLLHRQGGGESAQLLLLILVASAPAVLLGLADDVSKRIAPKVRLAGAAASAVLGMWLLGAVVPRADLPGIDQLLTVAPFAWLVTLLMVCGFVNAMNIVDGLNGLATLLAVAMAAATGFVAWQLGDVILAQICGILGAAVLGFFLVNFPKGVTFLGDGGAYFIGFVLAQLWILLLVRHPEVSPWFVMAVAAHPTIETVFSIYRRKYMRSRSDAMTADRLHLHSLVYRRWALRILRITESRQRWRANALASLALVGLAVVPMVLSVLVLSYSWLAFVPFVCYIVIYLKVFATFTKRGLLRAGGGGSVAPAPLVEFGGR